MFTPDYSDAIALAKHLNSDELKQLLNDDAKLESMIRDLEQVKTIVTEKEMLIASNKSLAEYNLSLQPQLESSREELISLYEQAGELKSKVLAKKTELANVQNHNEIETTLALLQTAATKADEESEAYFQKLLDGEVPLEEFINDYLKKRTTHHILRSKSDKMKSLVLRNNSAVAPPEKPARAKKAPLPPIPASNPPSLPYPSMPMPGFPVAPGFPNSSSRPETAAVPIRHAPRPPVLIPRRGSANQAPMGQVEAQPYPPAANPSVQQRRDVHLPMPPVTYSPYPQSVRLPLPN